MTNEIRDIDKAVAYEIIIAMGEDGLSALLTADDLLANMAVPVTQFDFSYADKSKMKQLMQNVERFLKSSKMSVNSYTKSQRGRVHGESVKGVTYNKDEIAFIESMIGPME